MINYGLLHQSQEHYKNCGYANINVPWWTSKEAVSVTKPANVIDDYFIPKNGKTLIASGEQGFIYMMMKGMLTEGKFQTTTPCFRDESQGILHQKYFMKNELIIPFSTDEEKMKAMINEALVFYTSYFDKDSHLLSVEKTHDGFDINLRVGKDDIELGSYGIRVFKNLSWIYGTGCAEPRTSRAKEILNNFKSYNK